MPFLFHVNQGHLVGDWLTMGLAVAPACVEAQVAGAEMAG